jgi:hypothetical protein
MYKFYKTVIAIFSGAYLRETTAYNTAQLLPINEARGFSEIIGSIGFMHWERKNYPFA